MKFQLLGLSLALCAAVEAFGADDTGKFNIEVSHPVCAVSTNDGFCRFPFRIDASGSEVAGAAVIVEAGIIEHDLVDIAGYMADGPSIYPAMLFGQDLNMNFPMASAQFNTNRWTMILIPVDAAGQPHGCVTSTFFTPEKDEDWEEWGRGTFTDLILSPGCFATSPEYEVVIEWKKGVTGMFRLVNPYAENPNVGTADMNGHTDHRHFLYINASDPDHVFIEESPTGIDTGDGDLIASSRVGHRLNYKKTTPPDAGEELPAGRMEGNSITFPAGAVGFVKSQSPDAPFVAGGEGELLRITEVTGIRTITAREAADDAPVEFYNLQGQRLASPARGTICISRKGAVVTKVAIP